VRGWFARRWASNQARCRNHDDSRHFVLVTLPLMTDSFILGRIRVAGIGVDWRKGKGDYPLTARRMYATMYPWISTRSDNSTKISPMMTPA
jgi:hypothetical protein